MDAPDCVGDGGVTTIPATGSVCDGLPPSAQADRNLLGDLLEGRYGEEMVEAPCQVRRQHQLESAHGTIGWELGRLCLASGADVRRPPDRWRGRPPPTKLLIIGH